LNNIFIPRLDGFLFEKLALTFQTNGNRKNIGYAALSAIYHELDLELFFNNRARTLKAEADRANVVQKARDMERNPAIQGECRTI